MGSEEEDLKRSIAGRIAIERRAFDRKPSRFGRCEFQSKLGKALDLRSNPVSQQLILDTGQLDLTYPQTVDNVLTNINQAGGIPKWFRVKQDCSAAPGFGELLSPEHFRRGADHQSRKGATDCQPSESYSQIYQSTDWENH